MTTESSHEIDIDSTFDNCIRHIKDEQKIADAALLEISKQKPYDWELLVAIQFIVVNGIGLFFDLIITIGWVVLTLLSIWYVRYVKKFYKEKSKKISEISKELSMIIRNSIKVGQTSNPEITLREKKEFLDKYFYPKNSKKTILEEKEWNNINDKKEKMIYLYWNISVLFIVLLFANFILSYIVALNNGVTVEMLNESRYMPIWMEILTRPCFFDD